MKEKFEKDLDAMSLTEKMDANQLEVFKYMLNEYNKLAEKLIESENNYECLLLDSRGK